MLAPALTVPQHQLRITLQKHRHWAFRVVSARVLTGLKPRSRMRQSIKRTTPQRLEGHEAGERHTYKEHGDGSRLTALL